MNIISMVIDHIKNGNAYLPLVILALSNSGGRLNTQLLLTALEPIIEIDTSTLHLRIALSHNHHNTAHLTIVTWRRLLVIDGKAQLTAGVPGSQ